MLKKVLLASVLAGAVAAMATASVLLDASAREQGIETSNRLNTLYAMPAAGAFSILMVAEVI